LPEADPETIAAVTQTLSLYGHAVDNAAWGLLGSVFAANSTIADGENVHDGPDALITALQARAEQPAHHVVNTQVKSLDSKSVAAWSRLITIAGDGSVASADQVDVVTSTGNGWLVVARVIHPRHGGTARIEDGATPWAP
jgi:lactam utilization protein B